VFLTFLQSSHSPNDPYGRIEKVVYIDITERYKEEHEFFVPTAKQDDGLFLANENVIEQKDGPVVIYFHNNLKNKRDRFSSGTSKS
jgi:hypothetical protein